MLPVISPLFPPGCELVYVFRALCICLSWLSICTSFVIRHPTHDSWRTSYHFPYIRFHRLTGPFWRVACGEDRGLKHSCFVMKSNRKMLLLLICAYRLRKKRLQKRQHRWWVLAQIFATLMASLCSLLRTSYRQGFSWTKVINFSRTVSVTFILPITNTCALGNPSLGWGIPKDIASWWGIWRASGYSGP